MDRYWGCHRCWHCVQGLRGADLLTSPPLTSPDIKINVVTVGKGNWSLKGLSDGGGGRIGGEKINAAGRMREDWRTSCFIPHRPKDLSHHSQHPDCLILLLPPSVLYPTLQ